MYPREALLVLEVRAMAYRQKANSFTYCLEGLMKKIKEVDWAIDKLKAAYQKPPSQSNQVVPAPDAQVPEQGKAAETGNTQTPSGMRRKRAFTKEAAIDFLMTKKLLIAPKCPTEKGVSCFDKWDGITYLPIRSGIKQLICKTLYEEFPDWTFCREFIANHLPSLRADFNTFKSRTVK
jgi:hypothetical protein